jgi:hypothetical protein
MNDLVAQLGAGQQQPEQVIAYYRNTFGLLPGNVRLHEAAYWSAAQASFLRDALHDDAEWAGIADELNARLHEAP